MSLAQMTTAPYDGARLARTLGEFRSAGRMDVSFGGSVLPDGTALQITGMCGTRTRSLSNLRVTTGKGLGGKSLVMAKPVSVVDYMAAQGITHTYDRAVSEEHLETVVALPILVDRRPRMVIYLANRTQVGLGDRWYDSFAPLVRRVERDLAVEDEVRRRLAAVDPVPAAPMPAVDPTPLSRTDLMEISAELTDLADLIDDDALKLRVMQLSDRVNRGQRGGSRPGRTTAAPTGGVTLAAREIDVLEQVALGRSNREAAAQLGIVESTVKSYLKNAMRKLNAHNRVQAIRLAQDHGIID